MCILNIDTLIFTRVNIYFLLARVAELVDALVLGTSAVRRKSSSLFFRTRYKKKVSKIGNPFFILFFIKINHLLKQKKINFCLTPFNKCVY